MLDIYENIFFVYGNFNLHKIVNSFEKYQMKMTHNHKNTVKGSYNLRCEE